MKLVVLAGAKKDTVVPLKKEQFTIGRAKECSLRAGSEAISRRHCEITRKGDGAVVRDLGSRNGTYVNDQKIEGEVSLSHGDRLRVGPLEFLYEVEGKLNDVKHPQVKSAGEAVARTAEMAQEQKSGGCLETSISDWLLEEPQGQGEQSIKETHAFSIDETRALGAQLATPDGEAPQESTEEGSSDKQASDDSDTKAGTDPEEDTGKKKEPGKLPKDAFAKDQPKDSTEAAAQILREMARRR